jgi:hypothetical protein
MSCRDLRILCVHWYFNLQSYVTRARCRSKRNVLWVDLIGFRLLRLDAEKSGGRFITPRRRNLGHTFPSSWTGHTTAREIRLEARFCHTSTVQLRGEQAAFFPGLLLQLADLARGKPPLGGAPERQVPVHIRPPLPVAFPNHGNDGDHECSEKLDARQFLHHTKTAFDKVNGRE